MKTAVIMGAVIVAVFTGSFCRGAEGGNPFGFETNTHPLEYEYCGKAQDHIRYPYLYICKSAPRSHPDFYQYDLNFLEGVGLCAISSWTFGKYTNKDSRLENLIEKLKEQLSKKYGSGRPEKFPGVYIWDKKAGFNGLGNVEQIRMRKWVQVHRTGKSAYSAYGIVVHFRLENMTLCQDKLYDKGSQAF